MQAVSKEHSTSVLTKVVLTSQDKIIITYFVDGIYSLSRDVGNRGAEGTTAPFC